MEHKACRLSLEVVVEEEGEHQAAAEAEHQVAVAPWMGYLWVVEAGLRRLQAAEAAAMEAGFRFQGWMWWWYLQQVKAVSLVKLSLQHIYDFTDESLPKSASWVFK